MTVKIGGGERGRVRGGGWGGRRLGGRDRGREGVEARLEG